MPVTDQWADLSTVEMINKSAQLCYGKIPVEEDLLEPPAGMNMFTASAEFHSPWEFMWSADRALRLAADLPGSHADLQSLLRTAIDQRRTSGDAEILFAMTWGFPDYSEFELIVPRKGGLVGYCTGHDPENIVATRNRINLIFYTQWGNQ